MELAHYLEEDDEEEEDEGGEALSSNSYALLFEIEKANSEVNVHLGPSDGRVVHWDKMKSVKNNLGCIVDTLSTLLVVEGSHLTKPHHYSLSNIAAYGASSSSSPPLQPFMKACMHIDGAKEANAKGIYQASVGGYVQVYLGIDEHGNPILEYAHRLVSFAIFGPPPFSTLGMQIMHTCSHRDCLNPTHLVWGTPWQNAQNSAEVYATLALEQHTRLGRSKKAKAMANELASVLARASLDGD